ncbi:twitching motility protein PilT [Thiohalorhabdus denitrificans]|uniref:PIN domain nuclease, a component of toxin-antitoxin system (PIN domain) n=1 Tax=Thiohalorhabdus denitrificans TaxID=381306 RepID=A0A0P9E9I5_9GAMM|nr:type II toxin-antitoxin system VapC family toxin [Thiohalorhabdus denitrificans]KPV39035.1 twitching motility protein PilT [Thiohalorhabdus denitrificans]SCX79459.1 PIN domain nuclease, a component of toxin-antitoxin system (PIN domain) [Thiohalorhabdus denitrificans]
MHLLLDTHVLLWAAGAPERLSDQAKSLIEDPENQPLFSAASLWEITIKRGLQRPDFQVEPEILRRGLVENGHDEVPITSTHAMAVGYLPPIHKDPFDRILVAQAETEGALLLTADDVVAKYPGPIRRV